MFLQSFLISALALSAAAQAPAASGSVATEAPAAVAVPGDYRIGADDVLHVMVWREADLSGDVVVRPDGRITLPLVNEVDAVGRTPAELRDAIQAGLKKFVSDPNVTISVRQINSRKVFITGNVERAGPYPILGPLSVVQLIALAGGLREYADAKHIVIMRTENGEAVTFAFNYAEVAKRKNPQQNILLKPGDTVIVP